MKIGLSSTVLEPVHNQGHVDGIGVYTTQLLRGLQNLGCEVVGYSFPPKSFLTLPQYSQFYPGTYAVLAGIGVMSGGLIRQDLPVDLMHFTDYRIFPVKCPVVATLHDAIPLKYPEMCNPNLRMAKNFLLRSSARFVDRVITLSQASVPDIVKYYQISEKKISVIGCGVDHVWLSEIDESTVEVVLRKYALQRGYFLFVGTLQPRKNLDRIIDAYRKLPAGLQKERKLVCVGRPGWRCGETIKKLCALVEEGHAIWLDNVSGRDELRCIYAGAGVFTFPSLYEGFGIPILEAFSCGVPVITSNISSLPEVSQQVGVEIDPTSVDEIVSAMEWLAKDDAECTRRKIAGKKLVASMTWDSIVRSTVEVYNKVI